MNKLQGKDLINVGIFTAIYFVVMMAIAMLGFIPVSYTHLQLEPADPQSA